MFARDADLRLYQWLKKNFGHDDYLRPNQAAEWPYVHCHHYNEIHECGNEEEEEEHQYQKDKRAFRKTMRRVANVWAQRKWMKRLRPAALRPEPSHFNIYQGPPLGSRPHLQKSMISTQIFLKTIFY